MKKRNKEAAVRKNLREAPVLESLFDKVADPKACNVIKKRLQHKCFL